MGNSGHFLDVPPLGPVDLNRGEVAPLRGRGAAKQTVELMMLIWLLGTLVSPEGRVGSARSAAGDDIEAAGLLSG